MTYIDYYVRYRVQSPAAENLQKKMKILQKKLDKLDKNIIIFGDRLQLGGGK